MYKQLYGYVWENKKYNHWAVRGIKFQGKIGYYSQLPGHDGSFYTCRSMDMAEILQEMISGEISNGSFNPAKYKKERPLGFAKFAERWLKDVRPSLAYKTYENYRTYINNWLAPVFGQTFLPDLNYDQILRTFNGIERSPKYKKNIHGCLRKILNDARKSGYIKQLPEPVKFKLARKVKEWIDEETQHRILDAIPIRHRPIFAFLFRTGIRPSEARALRKVDIKSDHIQIRSTFANVKGRGEQLKEVKQAEERVIPIYDSVRILLQEIPVRLTPFVFVNPDTGRPYTKNINRDIWNPACKKAGVKISLYNATRHSFAMQMLRSSGNMEAVSKALGHSNTNTTRQHYADYDVDTLKKVVDNVQRLR